MTGIFGVLAAHRRAMAILGAALAVCALAAGAARLAAHRLPPEPPPTLASGAPPEAAPKEPSAQELADTLLPSEALAARSAYGALERELVDFLAGRAWVAEVPGTALAFDETSFTETVNGEAATTAYVVVAAEGPAAAPGGATVRTFALQTPAGTFVARLVESTGEDGQSRAVLESRAFSRSQRWEAAPLVASLVVEGPDEAWFSQNGADPTALVEALDAFTASSWPAASRAVWGGTASYDYGRGVAELPFRIEGVPDGRVVAVLDLENGSFSVEAA